MYFYACVGIRITNTRILKNPRLLKDTDNELVSKNLIDIIQ